jgi:hypothetical protein
MAHVMSLRLSDTAGKNELKARHKKVILISPEAYYFDKGYSN